MGQYCQRFPPLLSADCSSVGSWSSSSQPLFPPVYEGRNSTAAWACSDHGYRPVKVLSRGQTSTVFLALNLQEKVTTALQRKVVVKIADKTGNIKRGLCRELIALRILQGHENVVSLVDYFETEYYQGIVTEWYSGRSLLKQLKQEFPVGRAARMLEPEARKVLFGVLKGMQHFHSKGIIHRNLSLSSILLDASKKVKIKASQCTSPFRIGGDVPVRFPSVRTAYKAPEVLESDGYLNTMIDEVMADVWSIGVIMFELLNGELPYNVKDRDVVRHMQYQKLHFHESLSGEAITLVRHLLSYDPDERPLVDAVLKDPWINCKGSVVKDGDDNSQNEPLEKYIQSHPIGNVLNNTSTVTLANGEKEPISLRTGKPDKRYAIAMGLRRQEYQMPSKITPLIYAPTLNQSSISDPRTRVEMPPVKKQTKVYQSCPHLGKFKHQADLAYLTQSCTGTRLLHTAPSQRGKQYQSLIEEQAQRTIMARLVRKSSEQIASELDFLTKLENELNKQVSRVRAVTSGSLISPSRFSSEELLNPVCDVSDIGTPAENKEQQCDIVASPEVKTVAVDENEDSVTLKSGVTVGMLIQEPQTDDNEERTSKENSNTDLHLRPTVSEGVLPEGNDLHIPSVEITRRLSQTICRFLPKDYSVRPHTNPEGQTRTSEVSSEKQLSLHGRQKRYGKKMSSRPAEKKAFQLSSVDPGSCFNEKPKLYISKANNVCLKRQKYIQCLKSTFQRV